MSVTLNQVLMLVGRLDDVPGFDAPCQRFRRFLMEHVTDVSGLRALIEECQASRSDDQRRALQDLVVLLGRFLGFETVFGSYQPLAGVLRYDGHWRSPRHLEVLLEVRSDRATAGDMSSLSRSIAALAGTSVGPKGYPAGSDSRLLGLCVLTPLNANRTKLERPLGQAKLGEMLRIMSLRHLLALAEMVSSGHLTHDDVLQLLDSSVVPDFVVDLLERSSRSASSASISAEVREPQFWFATAVTSGETPQQTVQSIVRDDGIFVLSSVTASQPAISPGDWICFCIPGIGVVGHARVASLDRDAATQAGGVDRVALACHLRQPDLYISMPVIPDFETQLRLTAAHSGSDPRRPALLSISREEFGKLTRQGDDRARLRAVAGGQFERGGRRDF